MMKAPQPEVVATASRQNPGETLRQAREQKGLSLSQVAGQLNLTENSLRQLENGAFDKLPGHTFSRGYIRAYAKLMGLDQAELVNSFDHFTGTNASGSTVQSLGRVAEPVRLSRNVLRIVSLLLLALLIGFGYFWWQEHSARTPETAGLSLEHVEVESADRYVINGQKVWISRIQHSDLMILLARTTPLAEVKRKSEGMSIFLVDLREAIGKGLTVQPIANMVNHETNELFFDNLEIPADSLIGEEGKGFRYILDGLNAERTLIAAECIGDGRWFIDKASHYARDRVVFGRPIGQNQGVQFPIAEAHIEVEAADLMRWRACQEYDAGLNAGASANMAKYLAAKASWEAANACLQTHGGFGFACEYDVERKFRETRLYQVAPISTNLILSYVAEHLLELPRSF